MVTYLTNGEIFNYIKKLRDLRLTSALVNKVNMNNTKLNVYKKYFKNFVKSLFELKSLLKIKLRRFLVMKNYQCKR